MSRLGSAAGRVQEGSLYVLLFFLPFAPAVVEIMFGVLLITWLLQWLEPQVRQARVWRRPQLRRLLWAILAYLVVCALSITVSEFPHKSLQGFIHKWVQYLLFFVMAAELGTRPRVMERAVTVMGWSAIFVIIEVLSQRLMGKGLFRGYPYYDYGRLTGPYRNPIDFATYLMVLIPLFVTAGITRRRWAQGALLTLAGIFLVYLYHTAAISAWLGLCVGVGGMAFSSRALRRPAMVLVAVLGLGGLWWFQHTGRMDERLALTDPGLNDRRVMWQAAIGMIKDRPILGHGVNTFMSNYLRYWVGGERQPRYAHNCYLQVAAETGIMGLVTFLALLGGLFCRLVVRLRQCAGSHHLLLVGCGVGLLAFAIQAGLDTNFYSLRQAALFWVLGGLALGLSERDISRASPAS